MGIVWGFDVFLVEMESFREGMEFRGEFGSGPLAECEFVDSGECWLEIAKHLEGSYWC